jgi:A/G-specific adenine glycosylase
VEKAEKREETVAVAVVQLVPPGASATGAAGLAASRFLLVQRPPSGLLAGLWQFPLLQLPEDAGEEPRRQQQLMDDYLEAQLGLRLVPKQAGSSGGGSGSGGGSVAVVERRPLGSLVHVFSHIRMTMKVERILLQGDISTADRAADEAGGLAALQWVPGSEMQGKGLSSGVRKVYKLFSDDRSKAGSKQSITAFFKPAAAK